jgi:peptidoglycan/LPS O-acetylase OafA/YrhL
MFPGGLGVLIFFVISGFLITRLTIANGDNLRLLQFWQRRIWRLYPAIVLYCGAVVIWEFLLGHRLSALEPIAALCYWANYLYGYWSVHRSVGHMPLEHFWSLSVEEHFYMLFPFLLISVGNNPKRVLVAMVIISIACLILRVLATYLWPSVVNTHAIYYTEVRMDSIAFGVMIAALCELTRGRDFLLRLAKPDIVATACLGLGLSLFYRNPWFRETIRYSIEAASISILLVALLFSERYSLAKVFLNWQPLVWIGILSYSLYVWHPLVEDVLSIERPLIPRLAWLILGICSTFLVASFSYYVVERPMRARFAGRKKEWA